MKQHITDFTGGHLLFIVCFAFYLIWWVAAFRPSGGVRGFRTGWLLIPAAIAGISGIVCIVNGISRTDTQSAAFSSFQILVAGIVVYVVLLAATSLLLKRQVTTELILIVGWLTLIAAEINAHYSVGTFSKARAVAVAVISLMIAAASLVCYLEYYKLDAEKGFIVGCVPLVLVILASAGMTILLW